jgi:hypothetical protein
MVALSPLDKQIILGASCGILERAGDLHDLREKLERQRAPKADIELLRAITVHFDTIYNNLRDVASRMEG